MFFTILSCITSIITYISVMRIMVTYTVICMVARLFTFIHNLDGANDIAEYAVLIFFLVILKFVTIIIPYAEIPIDIVMILICLSAFHDKSTRQQVCKFMKALLFVDTVRNFVLYFVYKIERFNLLLFELVSMRPMWMKIQANEPSIATNEVKIRSPNEIMEEYDEYELDE